MNPTEVTMETEMAIFSFLAYENLTKMPNIAIQSPKFVAKLILTFTQKKGM